MRNNDKLNRRQVVRLTASVGIVLVASLLISCGGDDDNKVDLSILEWSGYQQAKFHPEFNARYGGQPDVALFAEEKDAMLDPQSGVALFEQFSYGHANSKTLDLLDPKSIEGLGIDDPAGFFSRGVFTGATPPKKEARLYQLWFEAQAGLD